MKLKTVFFGTPGYAIPILDYLNENTELTGVVTRSDKQAGRHCIMTPSPVKTAALARNIPVATPEKLSDPEFYGWLSQKRPEIAVVLAYGKIIPADILKLFVRGNINIHFSLLPSYRGAAPVQWAIINGEKETGVTSFMMDEKLDTGKIICQKKAGIELNDDLESLRSKLVGISVSVLEESVEKLVGGVPLAGQAGAVSYAPKLKKSDGKIDWSMPAEKIYNIARGTKPSPCAYVVFTGGALKLDSMKILDCEVVPAAPGEYEKFPAGSVVSVVNAKGFVVKCGSGALLVKMVLPSSKNMMSAWAFLQGYKINIGDVLG